MILLHVTVEIRQKKNTAQVYVKNKAISRDRLLVPGFVINNFLPKNADEISQGNDFFVCVHITGMAKCGDFSLI